MSTSARKYLVVAGVAIALVVAFSLRGPLTGNKRDPGSPSAQEPSEISLNDRDTTRGNASLDPDIPAIPVPEVVARASDASERYERLQDCMTFRRFDRIFQQNAENPEYPLNDPGKMRAMPPEERKLLLERAELVESQRDECAQWASEVSEPDAGRLMYAAALKAAREGNVQAGVCYAMGLWPAAPSDTGAPGATREFANTRRELVLRGLAAGNWPAVIAANNMTRAEHGPQTQVQFSNEEAYVFARLLQMGMPDKALSESYGYDAAGLARQLDPDQVRAANARAEKLFLTAFGGRVMSEAERYENCGN